MKETLVSLLKYLLFPLSILYGGIIFLRNKLYDIGLLSAIKFDAIPVINVGNLSVGGTGKSPHIEYLIRQLAPKYHTATLSRGYGRSSRGFYIADESSDARKIGDEPLQFKKKFDNVIVAVAEDRVTAIPELLQRAPFIECILLDDAFQHRSVTPGKNILITTFDKPYTRDYILPFGRLRESRKAAKRADVIIVSKCPNDLSESDKLIFLSELNAAPNQDVYFTTIIYEQPTPLFDEHFEPTKETSAIVFSAIANAEPFINKIKNECKDVHELSFRDHYYFTDEDINDLKASFDYLSNKNKCIFVTEKDATRLLLHEDLIKKFRLPILVVPIQVSFLFNEGEAFNAYLNDYVYSYFTFIENNENTLQEEQYDDDTDEVIYEEIL